MNNASVSFFCLSEVWVLDINVVDKVVCILLIWMLIG